MRFTGGQQAGVIVKTILPGGVADQDGRLRPNDYILQINEHWLQGVGSERVAVVLRGTGNQVRLVVARPASDPNEPTGLPIFPSSILNDRHELELHLSQPSTALSSDMVLNPMAQEAEEISTRFDDDNDEYQMPEMVTLDVELVKDSQGLGVTIAGYTCEREDLSGIFVKSVTEGSAAHRSGKVAVNDQIIEVDGRSIQGFSNQQAVEMLRSTGKTVRLKLIRYVHGFKYEQLQQAIANSQNNRAPAPQPPPPPPPPSSDAVIEEEDSAEDYEGDLSDEKREALTEKWSEIMGPQYEIAVAQMSKFKPNGGLGISLEGTVEKVAGEEQNPHHYIRSVLPNGPVGQNGSLRSGDELLEVNGKKLLGLYHTDVVSILKDLPLNVRLVCARSKQTTTQTDISMSSKERLVKAKSDGSISSSSAVTEQPEEVESKLKSRSLEPLTSLAMWCEEVLAIELVKGDRGLGFSILDYQDPMNKEETVVVIRSLVPGGVAQQDGRLVPGDRLMYVNEADLAHASLDEAVQALKGAHRGIVRIGVSKPLPVPDTSTSTTVSQDDQDDETSAGDSKKEDDNTEVDDSEMESEMALPPTERLLGAPASSSTFVTTRYEEKVDGEDDIPPLPAELEHHIKVTKDSDQLGLQVDIEEGGINGLIVRSVAVNGTIGRDGRIRPGDYILKVNNENMRNISHSHALDILRRTQMVPLSQEIPITFIPASDAAVFKASVALKQVGEEEEEEEERRRRKGSCNREALSRKESPNRHLHWGAREQQFDGSRSSCAVGVARNDV